MYSKKIKQINDQYIKRLRCSVIGEGMLHPGNPYLMDYAIKNMPSNGIVLEIGVYGGLSTNLLLHLLNTNNRKEELYGCDAWVYEGYNDYLGKIDAHIDGRPDIARRDYTQYIKESFIKSTTFLNQNSLPHTCHLFSDDFFEQWNHTNDFTDVFGRKFKIEANISFAYIDGDHSYQQTEKDFNNVANRLVIGGYVLIDDSAKVATFGSSRYIKQIKKDSRFEIVANNPNFLIRKVK